MIHHHALPALLRAAPSLLLVVAVAAGGCSSPAAPSPPAPTPAAAAPSPAPKAAPTPPKLRLAADPLRIVDDLVADERVLRDPSSPEALMVAAARRQQLAYRALGRHPEWDAQVRARVPAWLIEVYDRNVSARRQLTALSRGDAKPTLPAWRIVAPRPADELMGYYRKAESTFGVGWNYLAAINLVETAFGRIAGVSTAGAQGPMQFMPATFAAYGAGGDITSPHDSIMAAGRYLAANNFARNPDGALWRYNNSNEYVRAVSDYAAALARDPAAFEGFYRWDVYYNSTAGDVVLPIGYAATAPIPVTDYLAKHPLEPPVIRVHGRSEKILEELLRVRNHAVRQRVPSVAEAVSSKFLGVPYGPNTLVGSTNRPEELIVNVEAVDCFTYVDYVEALKRADDREEFVDRLIDVRYKDGVVGFSTRRHFFTDWSAATPAIATDVTADLGARAKTVAKRLNRKNDGGVYLPGLPEVPRQITYIPSEEIDDAVVDGLRTGDYIGAYAADGGLDVTHVGMYVDTPNGPAVRNASSLREHNRVVDVPFFDYMRTIPGIVVLRPTQ
ncbi:lytic transglycosylase [Mycobacterium sp. IS-1496]|nr:N-acetylmuramoyl-L-alanine amidase-like domain-containing protein [Mycobacterium sp. IS-1496]KUI23081.1 lytic transglycosylase [Mycobacterium sp. IS-1496]